MNLRELFLWHARVTGVPEEVESAAVAMYRDAIDGMQPTFSAVRNVAQSFRISLEQAMIVFKQGVWRRTIPLDLFKPLLMDQRPRAQQRDVFDEYSDWFKR